MLITPKALIELFFSRTHFASKPCGWYTSHTYGRYHHCCGAPLHYGIAFAIAAATVAAMPYHYGSIKWAAATAPYDAAMLSRHCQCYYGSSKPSLSFLPSCLHYSLEQ